jgi:hypothetical protein
MQDGPGPLGMYVATSSFVIISDAVNRCVDHRTGTLDYHSCRRTNALGSPLYLWTHGRSQRRLRLSLPIADFFREATRILKSVLVIRLNSPIPLVGDFRCYRRALRHNKASPDRRCFVDRSEISRRWRYSPIRRSIYRRRPSSTVSISFVDLDVANSNLLSSFLCHEVASNQVCAQASSPRSLANIHNLR